MNGDALTLPLEVDRAGRNDDGDSQLLSLSLRGGGKDDAGENAGDGCNTLLHNRFLQKTFLRVPQTNLFAVLLLIGVLARIPRERGRQTRRAKFQ